MIFLSNFDKEPCVINDTLLRNTITSQCQEEEDKKLIKEQGIQYNEIKCLQLEYLDILQIDNLWILSGLVKLQLSNNLIEKIENLELLTNLKELDLSFNNITQLENLNSLSNLEVLSIFENKIQKLENLDKMKKLKVLSAGNNKLVDKDNIVYLRKFKYLACLSLWGNPLCHAVNSINVVYAYLPSLVYYDHKMISDIQKEESRILFFADLIALEEEENNLDAENKLKQDELHQEEINRSAFVEYLGGNQLFNSMFTDDPEGQALLMMTDEIHEVTNEYMKNFSSVAKEIHECGLKYLSIRTKEQSLYQKSVATAKEKSFSQSRKLTEKFLVDKNKMLNKVKVLLDSDASGDDGVAMSLISGSLQVINKSFQELCQSTWHILMEQELYLFEAIERVNGKLEISFTQQINEFVEAAQASFTQLRTMEDSYFEATCELAERYLTRVTLLVASTKDTAVPEQLLEIMRDKETLTNAISNSHDVHLQIIDRREDTLVSSARLWLRDFVNNTVVNEITRSRRHIAELNHFIDSQKEQLHSLLSTPTPMLPHEIQDSL